MKDPTGALRVWRGRSLADFLHEEDHIAAIKRFFIESIHQLRDKPTEFG
ncbi:hypothetical protein [Rubrobacter indicoceani]|nr:hypothetical protein [Rubrobacter indicoceani]